MTHPTVSGQLTTPNRQVSPATPGPADELELLARLRAGSEEAYVTLVASHTGAMLRVARRMLRNEEDARDAVQDAFLSALRSLDQFQGEAKLATWLHRIVVNASLMKLRRRRRKPELAIEDLLPRFLEDGHQVHSSSEWNLPADEAVGRREVRVLVRSCIDRLPETYRTVLLLRDIEDFDTEEAARLLEISPTAVKVRLHRARQALRTLLDPHFNSTHRTGRA
ncbi:MAG: sigma-70 family RNA polymerase sigma factor [Vicinamibacteria bacterium]